MAILGNINIIMIYSIALLVGIHSFKFRGAFKTLILFFGSLLVGIGIENINALFGGYRYPGVELTWFWYKAPFDIGLGWFALIYCCGYFSHILVGNAEGSAPTIGIGTEPINGVDLRFIKLTLLRALLAGIIAVSFDLIMDPMAVHPKNQFWIWEIDSIYFQGVPLNNYIGWACLIGSFAFFHDIIVTHLSLKDTKKIVIAIGFTAGCILAMLITGLILMGFVNLFSMEGIRTEGLDTHPLDASITAEKIQGLIITAIYSFILIGFILLSSLAKNKKPDIPEELIWRRAPAIFMLLMYGVVMFCAAMTDPILVLIGLIQPLLFVIVAVYFLIKPYTD
ncbi:MAG: carotenoid biosynthesis protein [Promethearchaeota archaeon]